MFRKKLLFILFLLSALIAVLHLSALEYTLYFIYPWFDILLHFLGGVLIALIFLPLYIFLNKKNKKFRSKMFLILLSVSFAGIIGVFWEIFEFCAGIVPTQNYALDMSLDIFMDIIGGILGSFFVLYLKDKYLRDVKEDGDVFKEHPDFG